MGMTGEVEAKAQAILDLVRQYQFKLAVARQALEEIATSAEGSVRSSRPASTIAVDALEEITLIEGSMVLPHAAERLSHLDEETLLRTSLMTEYQHQEQVVLDAAKTLALAVKAYNAFVDAAVGEPGVTRNKYASKEFKDLANAMEQAEADVLAAVEPLLEG